MEPRVRKVWRPVHGVLLLDKDLGLSSNDALQKARRLFSAAKGGHTGTLDPLATGLLPLCFGEATKFSADLLDADKTYTATLKLGVTTDSGDAEGQVTRISTVNVTLEDVLRVLPALTGDILQVPPMHSALKRDGRPLYELARQGIVVERAARPVTIHRIESLELRGDVLRFSVHCSKGTYVRVLASDIGEALGCGAHLTALRRTRVGDLVLAGAHTLADIEALPEAQRSDCLLPVDALLQSLPRLEISGLAEQRFRHGNPIDLPPGCAGKVRVYDAAGQLLGVAEPGSGDRLWPKRLIQL